MSKEEPQERVKQQPLSGQKLARLRQFLQLSLADFAHELGVSSPSNIHYWENNGLSKKALNLIEKRYQLESELFSANLSLAQFSSAVNQLLLSNHVNQKSLEVKSVIVKNAYDDLYLLDLEHDMNNRLLVFDTFPSFALKYNKAQAELLEKNAATQLRFENINHIQMREYHNYSLRGVLSFIFNPVLPHSIEYKKRILANAVEFFTSMNHSLFIFNEKSENISNAFSDMQLIFNDSMEKQLLVMISPLFYSSQARVPEAGRVTPSDISYFLQLEGEQVREYVDFYIHQIKVAFHHIDGFALLVLLLDYLQNRTAVHSREATLSVPDLTHFLAWLSEEPASAGGLRLQNGVTPARVAELALRLKEYFEP
ncbi:hypothetical protein D5085_08390 [Ectothiorhodospiraceae bacterium BW-2]|nr:hypothetical protein D5085_08390 [Ectothiorhodospiraceae bacterium BW-2]